MKGHRLQRDKEESEIVREAWNQCEYTSREFPNFFNAGDTLKKFGSCQLRELIRLVEKLQKHKYAQESNRKDKANAQHRFSGLTGYSRVQSAKARVQLQTGRDMYSHFLDGRQDSSGQTAYASLSVWTQEGEAIPPETLGQ